MSWARGLRRCGCMQDEEFPTGLFLLVALGALVGVVVIGAIFVTAGIGGMLIAALVAIAVGVPLAIHKTRAASHAARDAAPSRSR